MASSNAAESAAGGLAMRLAILAALVAAPFALGESYGLHLLIIAGIFAILASSLALIVGQAGLLSLGHAAFFGLGAYTSALLYLNFGLSMWGGLLAAFLVSAAAAFLIGALVLRVRGNRFIITTVAFAEISRLVVLNSVDVTRGQMGLAGIKAPVIEIPGLVRVDLNTKVWFYFVVLAALLLCLATVRRLVRSPIGWGLAALRENERLGESVGVSAFRHAMIAFVIGGAFAGMAGSLQAHYLNFVSPDLFLFSYTTTILVMVVIGGKSTIIGPVIGAVLFTLLPEYLRVADKYRLVFLGAVLLVTILALPNGVVELWERLRSRVAPGARVPDEAAR
jgi:branched-chain amino acid transport system permease protein